MLLIPVLIVIFLTGLIVGSFLNCVIYRLETGGSFLKGRSFCPHCKHQLSWQDLIPILSFLILRGKCRYCQKKISWQYPFVELTTGILFVLVILKITTMVSILSIYYFIIISFLVVIFVYDLKHYIIPDKLVYPAIGIAFFYHFFEFWSLGHWDLFRNWKLEIGNLEPLTSVMLSAIGAATFFLLIVLVSHGRWMGVGDVKLAALMGLILGWPKIFVALFLAFFGGAIIGLGLIFSGKKTLKSEVPFGPFLVTGTFLAMFWGKQIITWYLNFFLLK